MDLIEPIWGISKSGVGCPSCSKQANENEGDEAKKSNKEPPKSPISPLVCAVASRLNLTRAKDGARLAAIKVFPT